MISLAEILGALDAANRAAEERRSSAKGKSKDFYTSPAWRRLRYVALRANREKYGKLTCVVCGGIAGPFHVDHIEPLSKNWARRLDPTNLQVMDEACNLGKSNTDRIDWRG
jgi:5-methylcytosine-specific restriction endonuclease McrA